MEDALRFRPCRQRRSADPVRRVRQRTARQLLHGGLPFDPKPIDGFSEKILVSHHEINYAGAVKRLNAITAQLANLDWATAPNFVINGLKRAELIAANSMILHEYFFAAVYGHEPRRTAGSPR